MTLWACRRMVGKTRRLHPEVMFWLYLAVVRPLLTYASLVWWLRMRALVARRNRKRIQRLAFTCFTGAIKTTPTAALDALLELHLLHLVVEGAPSGGGSGPKDCSEAQRYTINWTHNFGHTTLLKMLTRG